MLKQIAQRYIRYIIMQLCFSNIMTYSFVNLPYKCFGLYSLDIDHRYMLSCKSDHVTDGHVSHNVQE